MKIEAKYFLLMMAFLSFAQALSNIFISIFIWNINSSLSLLALHSLAYSVAVLVSFPACALYARKTSPMACSRIGICLFILTYGFLLLIRENAVNHVIELGILTGLSISFFVIGEHMLLLDLTEDRNRDRFLYLLAFITNFVGMLAPIVSGFTIHHYEGMSGYYVIFAISFLSFLITALVSFKVKGKKLPKQSYLKEVWKNPTRQWRGMYWISMGTSIVEGTYSSFLVTIMTFSIVKDELALGGYNTFASLVGLFSSLILAKISKPERRLTIYSIGSILLASSSILIAMLPTIWTLAVYGVLSIVGFNLISRSVDAWMYSSIEFDKNFADRRLDYIVVREVPLGIGRIFGIGLFFILNTYIAADKILPISFALFGSVFIFLIIPLKKIWCNHSNKEHILLSIEND